VTLFRGTRPRDPGWCGPSAPKAWPGMPAAPAVRIRRRGDTDTNFDSNRSH